jgi:hypothetical protein
VSKKWEVQDAVEQNVFLQDALREVKVLPVTPGCHLAHFDWRNDCRDADAQDVHAACGF